MRIHPKRLMTDMTKIKHIEQNGHTISQIIISLKIMTQKSQSKKASRKIKKIEKK